jgi:hypothetical protein
VTTPAQPQRSTSIVCNCNRCRLTVWTHTTDRDGVCLKCRERDLVTLVPAPKKPRGKR